MLASNTPPKSTSRKRTTTPEGRIQRNLEKRQRQVEVEDTPWRPIDPKKECFVIDELPPEESFLTLKIERSALSYLDIFTKFMTDSIADSLIATLMDEDTILSRHKSGPPHRFSPSIVSLWQTIAVQVRMIGEQERTVENNRFIRTRVTAALNHFRELDPEAVVTSCEVIERLNARMVMTESFSEEISENFRSIVRSLGQFVAGDEKLFQFTGKNGNVRLIMSKPVRPGFWFYELCGRFSNGLPYMIDVFMDKYSYGAGHFSSVVETWIDSINIINQENGGTQPSKCILAMDTHHMSDVTRQICENSGIHYCCSVNEKCFAAEVRAVRPPAATDEAGQWHGIYNENNNQLFVYHHDTQKGVGKKYNHSYGFQKCTDKRKVKQYATRIPAHDHYKTFFECCDNFNQSLKDVIWSQKRGSCGLLDNFGVPHDFLMGCILQNTFNAWHEVTGTDHSSTSFEKFCLDLSEQLFFYSQDFVPLSLDL